MAQLLTNSYLYENGFQAPQDFHISPEIFVDFDSNFQDDEDYDNSSSLQSSSKKICKMSKTSYKKSKKARNPWTSQEDAKVMELMKKYGQSWAMISSQLEGRTGKQVRDRYLNKLRPNIKCGDWSNEEDNLFVKLMKEVGNKWSLIANHLPGRTEGQVKNRYYSSIKKRLQPDGTLSLTTSESKANSEDLTSFTTSPQMENTFDMGHEFDVNMFNAGVFSQDSAFTNGNNYHFISEELCSESSTTQCSNSQSGINSPLRVNLVDPTDVISYDVPEFYKQPSTFRPFHIAPIQYDCQVDSMLNNVTNYIMESENSSDSYLSSVQSTEIVDERLTQLNMRKAYLELALAKTLQEINGF